MKNMKYETAFSDGVSFGSDVPMNGSESGFSATPIPPMQQKKFGQNSGWLTATGETQTSVEMED
jgi:hypothetical protein